MASTGLSDGHMRVIVIEDNWAMAHSLRLLLELAGHQVGVVHDGPEGVRAAVEWQPEVVLCDIGLPGLDGYGVATALRRNPETAHSRLIAITAYGSDEAQKRSAEVGFERHLTKPVEPDVLLELLAASRYVMSVGP
jgi:CheY-like chemotaxis protein